MDNPEETIDINTPENVTFGYQVAGLGSRFLATLLDTLIILLLQVVVVLTFFLIIRGLENIETNGRISAWVYAVLGFVSFLFYWGYYIFFEMLWNGQSPGKRWAGIRVIRSDGTPITLSESFIRNLTRLVDLLPMAYGVGIVVMFIDKQSRRLGDLAASTLVVHDRAPISIQSLSEKASVVAVQGRKLMALDGFPFERLTNNDLSLIEDFLQRRDQLTHHEQLAGQIVNALHVRLGLPQPAIAPSEAENMLLTILYTVQRRQADEYWRNHDNQRTEQ